MSPFIPCRVVQGKGDIVRLHQMYPDIKRLTAAGVRGQSSNR